MDDFMDFGEGFTENALGPLIGGGMAQVGHLATKALFPAKAKYASIVGTLLGLATGAALMATRHKGKAMGALAGAAIVGVPRIIEDLLMPAAGLAGADDNLLGAYMAEQMGTTYLPSEMGDDGSPISIADSGSGTTGMQGAYMTEQLNAMPEGIDVAGAGAGEVEIAGFGANFLS